MSYMKHLKNILYSNIKIFLSLTLLSISGTVLTGCSRTGYTNGIVEEKDLNNTPNSISGMYNEIQMNFSEDMDEYYLVKISGNFMEDPEEHNICYKELKFSFLRYVSRWGEGGLYGELYITADMEGGVVTIEKYLIEGRASTLPSIELLVEEDENPFDEIEGYLFENIEKTEQRFEAWRSVGSITREAVEPGKLGIEIYSKQERSENKTDKFYKGGSWKVVLVNYWSYLYSF